MAILDVTLNDTFDQWRLKTNSMIDKVNTLGAAGDVISVSTPTTAQILVFDGTTFRNVTLSGDANILSNGSLSVTGGISGGLTRGRVRFAGSMTSLY